MDASIISFCLCSLILNFGLSTALVALFLGRGVLIRWGIFGLCDGRYLERFCHWTLEDVCDRLPYLILHLYAIICLQWSDCYTSGVLVDMLLLLVGIIFETLMKDPHMSLSCIRLQVTACDLLSFYPTPMSLRIFHNVVHKPGCIRFGFDTSILDRSSIVPCLTPKVQEVANPLKIFLWLHGSFRKNKDCK